MSSTIKDNFTEVPISGVCSWLLFYLWHLDPLSAGLIIERHLKTKFHLANADHYMSIIISI